MNENLMSRKKIIVTEKPSVAAEYAKVLGVSKKNNGYFESDEWLITWCVGHLVTLAYPDVYDEKMKKWSLSTLPFLPERYEYTVIKAVSSQYKVIKALYNRADIDTIYYAGDAGREGIYIQALVRQEAGHNKNAKELVVWIDSQTEEEIRRGIREAQELSSCRYQNLIASGYERAIEDFATGINFSRALTLKYALMLNKAAALQDYVPISVGRVMTCVLGMVVKREREIQTFKPVPFYRIKNMIVAGGVEIEGVWRAVEGSSYLNSPKLYDDSGFKEKEDAQAFIDGLSQSVRVERIEKSIEKKAAPSLLNLSELQAACSKIFKISPDITLEIAQSLYEKKLTTYPRTDARVLSTAVAKEIHKNVSGLRYISENSAIAVFAETVIENGWDQDLLIKKNKKYVDDSKITDHYAIIPTGEIYQLDELKPIEKEVYLLIAKRFLSIFYPPAEYEKVLIKERVGNECFYAGGKMLVKQGYLSVLGQEKNNAEQSLKLNFDGVKENAEYPTKYDLKQGETSPPKRYTSGNMVLAMENAGKLIEDEDLRMQIKDNGIGTSATRAETIKKLVKLSYIDLNPKTQVLTPATLGNMVYEVVNLTIPELLNPKMTASWEKGLHGIQQGEVGAGEYRAKLEAFVRGETEKIKDIDKTEEIAGMIRPFAKAPGYEKVGLPFVSRMIDTSCPDCGGRIKTAPFGYVCEHYNKEKTGCKFAIGRVAGILMEEDQIKKLLCDGRTDNINGFVSKNKKIFSAALELTKDKFGKTTVKFDFSGIKPEVLEETPCPLCGREIYITPYGYGCSGYEKGNMESCRFFIGRIAGKMLTREQVRVLAQKKRVGPLKGFTSKAGKSFEAVLILDENGKVDFDFPEQIEEESDVPCPKCGINLLKDNIFYSCTCGFKIPYLIAGKRLSEKELSDLMKGRTKKLKGFKSKKGKRFEAVLVADCNGKVSFEFG